MTYTVAVTTAPTIEPVTLAEVLTYLRLDATTSTTLASAATAADTSIDVASASGLTVGDTLAVGNETATITGISGTTITITPALPNDVPSGSSVTTGPDHALVASLITAARQHTEAFLGRALNTQTQTLTQDAFRDPTKPNYTPTLRIPNPPTQSVTSITYTKYDQTAGTVTATTYAADTSAEPAVVMLKDSQAWPTDARGEAAVTLTYVAGYGDNRSDVPQGIREAIKRMLALMYARECSDCTRDPTVRALLDPYRVWAF